MISTFQALAVTLLFILPGAAYTFALERVGGSFGVKLVDRIFRFLAASAVFQALLSGLELWAYREWVASGRLGLSVAMPKSPLLAIEKSPLMAR